MKKKIAALAGAVLAGALALSSSIASASSQGPPATTITLTGHATSVQLIEEGKTGFSPGDRIVLAGVLLSHGKPSGRFGVDDTAVNTHPNQVLEVATFVLGGGELTFQDMRSINRTDFTVPITGGTGAYRTARGQATLHVTSTGNFTVTVELSP